MRVWFPVVLYISSKTVKNRFQDSFRYDVTNMFFKLVINRAASYEHILGRTGFIWRATIVMCFASYSNAVRMFSIANAPIPTMTTFFSLNHLGKYYF